MMLKISIFFIFCFNLLASFKCYDDLTIQVVTNGKVKNEKMKTCFNHELYDVISYSCLEKNCDAIQRYRINKKLKPKYLKQKTPLHHKCHLVGGSPQFVTYLIKKKKVQSARCLFPDNSFISVFNKI